MIILNKAANWWLCFYPIHDSKNLMSSGYLHAPKGILINIIVPLMKGFLNH